MSREFEEFVANVKRVESDDVLVLCAKRSFESFSPQFLDEDPILEYYKERIMSRPKSFDYRSPLQRERDRIVHSPQLRALVEKFHVLYFENQKISRSYITHVMRMAQITRAICRGLRLNEDFAEAIALGCKVGCVPFPYLSKDVVSEWTEEKFRKIDKESKAKELPIPSQEVDYPPWLRDLSAEAQNQIRGSGPVAKLSGQIDAPYSTGKQSFWLLSANAYTKLSVGTKWQKETVYGIWRHSLDERQRLESEFKFNFNMAVGSAAHSLSYQNDTYEAMAVRLADDITWVIENLQDANQARMIATGGKGQALLDRVAKEPGVQWPPDLLDGLVHNDVSLLYNYFIKDCVENTQRLFEKAGEDALFQRKALRAGDMTEAKVALSDEAFETLRGLKAFLYERVFADARTDNRNRILKTILRFLCELLYGDENLPIPEDTISMVFQRAMKYPTFDPADVITEANKDPYFRVQLVVNLMSEMSDREIFNLIGMGEV